MKCGLSLIMFALTAVGEPDKSWTDEVPCLSGDHVFAESSFPVDVRHRVVVRGEVPEGMGDVLCCRLGGTNICDAVVIADVVSVDLVAVTGFDLVHRFNSTLIQPMAQYRVVFNVRETLSGRFSMPKFEILTEMSTSLFQKLCRWWYYRGMTLKVALDKEADGFVISHVEPALPYAPYASAAEVRDGQAALAECGAEQQEGVSAKREYPSIAVRYSDGSVVVFRAGEKIGEFNLSDKKRTVYDFGFTTDVFVLSAPTAGAASYWTTSWFSDRVKMCVKGISTVE